MSPSELTIVMYHYVRDLRTSRWALKARHLEDFIGQLDYIAAEYTVVTAEQIVAATKGHEPLPPSALWLTFDDGYSDHYKTVFPLLCARDFQGSFFAPARAITERTLLDVNKVHVLLATEPDHAAVTARLNTLVDERVELRRGEGWWHDYGQPTRFDKAHTAFVKRMFQFALPEPHKTDILDVLFAEYVSTDQRSIADEYYATTDQLREMVAAGMYVGSHGYDHFWLDKIDAAAQRVEVDLSLQFLTSIGARTHDWVMCYPYGARNSSLLEILRSRDCAIGITTVPKVARVGVDEPLELPRIDTNDLQCQRGFSDDDNNLLTKRPSGIVVMLGPDMILDRIVPREAVRASRSVGDSER